MLTAKSLPGHVEMRLIVTFVVVLTAIDTVIARAAGDRVVARFSDEQLAIGAGSPGNGVSLRGRWLRLISAPETAWPINRFQSSSNTSSGTTTSHASRLIV